MELKVEASNETLTLDREENLAAGPCDRRSSAFDGFSKLFRWDSAWGSFASWANEAQRDTPAGSRSFDSGALE